MIFQYVCHMSLWASYVFLIVLLVRKILWKCPRKYTYFLWFLVFLRFACPVFPEGPFSLIPTSEVRVQAEIGMERAFSQGSAFNSGGEYLEHSIPDSGIQEEAGEQEAFLTETADDNEKDSQKNSAENGWSNALSRLRRALAALWLWLPFPWVLGVIALLLYHGLSYVRLKRQLSKAVPIEPGVYELSGEHLSFVAGLLHPAVYISRGLDPEARRVICL